MTSLDEDDLELPPGWVTEEESADRYSWFGPAEHVVCKRSVDNSDEWMAYVQSRGELGAHARTPLLEGGATFEEVLSEIRSYMRRNSPPE